MFPISVDQECDISVVSTILMKEILHGKCRHIPKQLDFDVYIVSRYYFLQRVYLTLKKNGLEQQVCVFDI